MGNLTDIGAFEAQDHSNGEAMNNNLIVSTLEDENDDDFSAGDLSLREAILNSNDGDIITFESNLSGGTIDLVLGELVIDKSLTLEGSSANNLTIDANGNSRVFNIDDHNNSANQDVTLNGLTITGGGNVADGSGIYNQETLTVKNTTISDNTSNNRGGAIANQGTADISNSTISGNYSTTGGGINNSDKGILTIGNTTISNNFGGGIFNANSATVNSSIIANFH